MNEIQEGATYAGGRVGHQVKVIGVRDGVLIHTLPGKLKGVGECTPQEFAAWAMREVRSPLG